MRGTQAETAVTMDAAVAETLCATVFFTGEGLQAEEAGRPRLPRLQHTVPA